MSYELIDGVDGQQYVVGTLVPDPARLSSMTQPRLSDVMPLLSDDDVMDIVNDPDLPLGRDRWDDSWTFDQGPVGKCATTATKGILMRVRDLQGLERIELSDDYIYVHVNGGRDQGSLLIDVIHQAERGTCPARFVQDGTIKMSGVSPEAHANASFRALEGEWCQIKSEQELKTAICMAMPVNVAWHFTNQSPRLDADGLSAPTNGRGNHSVLCDGLKRRDRGFIYDTQNSHGKRFGDKGRCFLGWNEHMRHTVNYHVFWALRVTESTSNTPDLD